MLPMCPCAKQDRRMDLQERSREKNKTLLVLATFPSLEKKEEPAHNAASPAKILLVK